jgi:photosystem II stability/assembly factor-like uncharacterized protein
MHRLILIALLTLGASGVYAADYDWRAASFGGGGKYQGPAVSPLDEDLLIACGNMGGTFISRDGGESFDQVPFYGYTTCLVHDASPRNPWHFSFNDPDTFLAFSQGRILVTTDGGRTWSRPAMRDAESNEGLTGEYDLGAVTLESGETERLLGAFIAKGKEKSYRVAESCDWGDHWKLLGVIRHDAGPIIDIQAVKAIPGRYVLATERGLFLSDDSGKSWTDMTDVIPALSEGYVHDFAAGSNEAQSALYLTTSILSKPDGQTVGGIYVSRDGGRNWQVTLQDVAWADKAQVPDDVEVQPVYPQRWTGRPGYYEQPIFRWLSACQTDPKVAYVCVQGRFISNADSDAEQVELLGSNIYRTDDAGKTWAPVLFQNPFMKNFNIVNRSWMETQWGWGQCPTGVYVSPSNPDHVMATTGATVYSSQDGGVSWEEIAGKTPTKIAPIGSEALAEQPTEVTVPAGGMLNTSVWNVYFDPYREGMMYIPLADFGGFWRSENGGRDWMFSTAFYAPQLGNNGYGMAFSPDVPGKLWAGASFRHDIPVSNVEIDSGHNKGGLVYSEDYGETWHELEGRGLPPHAGSIPTDIIVEPRTRDGAHLMWAVFIGRGIYHSEDDGESWRAMNDGLDPNNMNVCYISQTEDGVMYALSVVKAWKGELAEPGTLYRSDDYGKTWRSLRPNSEAFLSPMDYCVDPHDSDHILLAASTRQIWKEPSPSKGVWESVDGGSTWSRIWDMDCVGIDMDPSDPQHLFASVWDGGLWESHDGGKTWEQKIRYPFSRPFGVVFDPTGSGDIYVYSYGGGMWKGTLKP